MPAEDEASRKAKVADKVRDALNRYGDSGEQVKLLRRLLDNEKKDTIEFNDA